MKTLIIPITAMKRQERDNWRHGCDPDTSRSRFIELPSESYSIIDCMSELVGTKLTKDDIYTFDPNIYCDTKEPPGYRISRNNQARGQFRVEHDRLENNHGRQPSKREMAEFKGGDIELWHTTYELYFEIRMVDMDENELADTLGVNHPN